MNLLFRSSRRVANTPHWLCIAYAFPPLNRSGTHRTLGFVRELDRLGWNAAVVTVNRDDLPTDDDLLAEVPSSVYVVRTRWINLIEAIKNIAHWWRQRTPVRINTPSPLRSSPSANRADARRWSDRLSTFWSAVRGCVSQLVITPDTRIGWILPGVWGALRAVWRRRPDVIYSTSPYMSAHLIAWAVSRLTGIPLVADFRDPWRGNPFRRIESGFADWWDAFLERRVLKRAAHIVCCTPTMTVQLRERHPFAAGKCSTILNGFDPERFADIPPQRVLPEDKFILTHAGQFYGTRSPLIWFEALRDVICKRPELAFRIRMVLVGNATYEGQTLNRWASQAGVGAMVHALGPRSHAQTLSILVGSDALMLGAAVGDSAQLQIPNKLFEYLAVRRPILTVCTPDNPTVQILDDADADATVCGPGDVAALADAIIELVDDEARLAAGAWSGVAQFERSARARELANLFARVTGRMADADERLPIDVVWPLPKRRAASARTQPNLTPTEPAPPSAAASSAKAVPTYK